MPIPLRSPSWRWCCQVALANRHHPLRLHRPPSTHRPPTIPHPSAGLCLTPDQHHPLPAHHSTAPPTQTPWPLAASARASTASTFTQPPSLSSEASQLAATPRHCGSCSVDPAVVALRSTRQVPNSPLGTCLSREPELRQVGPFCPVQLRC